MRERGESRNRGTERGLREREKRREPRKGRKESPN